MKIAILSDIHANLPALEAVLNHAQDLEIDYYCILGDLVGYYLNPKEVVERIMSLPNSTTIQGNHERLLINAVNKEVSLKELNDKFGEGHSLAIKCLSQEQLKWLSELPVEKDLLFDNLLIKLCHGAPSQPDYYLYPTVNKSKLEEFLSEEYDYIFTGHSHYPFITARNNTLLINVGSVGMSKDVGGIASWGMIDTSNKVYVPYRTPFNVDKVKLLITETKNTNGKYLINILNRRRYDREGDLINGAD
ncbi:MULTISPECIES: metallophosphoesterase [unclassified Sporosarcina]|uniref:metallophosphoesterase family protein n=1 Tax=unclassified Sporosarcina TaxID=2647733 RepID=UPI00203FC98A|nr:MULTISPECIES: metallophosphoesterase family protein [unclassified Sporosarcina]GKV64855.1 hypothetical protein NCCP2331_10080 [Sporosarcina sp. NCCP-2331]GLB54965.1 hypothetical protein NCCP2378_07500 [Sporosarcina sp. NCCP-2378]